MKSIAILMMILCSQWVHASNGDKHPLNQLKMAHFGSKSVFQNQKPIKNNTSLHRYMLVLFFSNQCPHCVQFAPVVKHFIDANHWSIEAISLNGETLPEFPKATFATQEMIDLAYQGKPVVYPALFIANSKTKVLYPVSFGELGKQELLERMRLIMEKISEYEGSH
jgi:type-F conjugative transfer system pilin assembly thiol-disulfide isomerase TrbB